MPEDDEQVTISRQNLEKILEMHADATELLEKIPEMQDKQAFSQASQEIGAELEARVTEMNKVEKSEEAVREILQDLHNEEFKGTSLEDLEKQILG